MNYIDIIQQMDAQLTYLDGVKRGLVLLSTHYNWCPDDWEIEYDDIGSDYRLLKTTLDHLSKQ
jgi:hypothetical protein